MAERDLSDYVEVSERILDFRKKYPDGSLQAAEPWRLVQAEGWEKNGDHVMQCFVVYVAAAYRSPDDPRPGVGVAWEIFPGRTPYTRGSELQNAETSAWGRAIIAVGASDAKRGIASREEVQWRRAERDDGLPVNRDGSLSRSRTGDEEKAAAGVMTSAQLAEHTELRRGAATGRVAGTQRLAAVPDDDPWYGQSPGPTVEDQPASANEGQVRSIQALYSGLGIKDREQRLQVSRVLLGIDFLASHKELSYRQAGDLQLRLRAADPADRMAIEAARRAT